jgi:dTDP-4-dehydrorhamnose reductase
MKKVLVIGASGMLGIGVLKALEGASGVTVSATTRDGNPAQGFESVATTKFVAGSDSVDTLISDLAPGDYVINCIGVIKPYIKDENPQQRKNAMLINGLFPDELANATQAKSVRVIQIATDCVYSGAQGSYVESDPFDATDVYGKTKSLGEVPLPSMMHLRVSIIGPESGRSSSLFEWVRNQPANAQINGFTDHEWNGVTTYHYGLLCRGIVTDDLFAAGTYHVVPGSRLSKFELVSEIAKRAGRADIVISPKPAGSKVDRTLETSNASFNESLWRSAGFSTPPTVEKMIQEMPIGDA